MFTYRVAVVSGETNPHSVGRILVHRIHPYHQRTQWRNPTVQHTPRELNLILAGTSSGSHTQVEKVSEVSPTIWMVLGAACAKASKDSFPPYGSIDRRPCGRWRGAFGTASRKRPSGLEKQLAPRQELLRRTGYTTPNISRGLERGRLGAHRLFARAAHRCVPAQGRSGTLEPRRAACPREHSRRLHGEAVGPRRARVAMRGALRSWGHHTVHSV
jgi:hypothetical protein